MIVFREKNLSTETPVIVVADRSAAMLELEKELEHVKEQLRGYGGSVRGGGGRS